MSKDQKDSLYGMAKDLRSVADSFTGLADEIRKLADLYEQVAATESREIGILAIQQTRILQKYIDVNGTFLS
jgi:hypothetical protein